ncbi:glutamate ABC transporter substrate-binding protein [Kineosporia sp. NBRC 101677]|uniref:glutamate ABC transporter substrate-binding protein n=1 Tax=Kineosporia sp. NBRC 101677 TaxID=3032197 RepID=UPI0025577D82|nr:glutamate ABC transporter substrate-binding protein [Kineosporia sp. NBRC 101677]
MTNSTRARRILTATAAGALLLSGCAGASSAGEPGPEAIAAQPVAATATEKNCPEDNLPREASLATTGASLNPATWSDKSTMAEVRSSGKLVVGVAGDVNLWGSRKPGSTELQGFDIDVANRIADAIGPKVQVEYEVINFADRLPRLKNGDVQLVAHTMTMTCERWFGSKEKPDEFINFSTEYYRAGQKVLVRSDSKATGIDDLKGQTVCAATGSTSLANLEGRGVTPVEVGDVGECLVRFQEGETTAITGDDTVLAGFRAQDKYAKVVGDAFTEVPYGLGIAPGDYDFTRFVNLVLEQMRTDGTLDGLYDKWMKGNGAKPAVPKAVYGRQQAALEKRG